MGVIYRITLTSPQKIQRHDTSPPAHVKAIKPIGVPRSAERAKSDMGSSRLRIQETFSENLTACVRHKSAYSSLSHRSDKVPPTIVEPTEPAAPQIKRDTRTVVIFFASALGKKKTDVRGRPSGEPSSMTSRWDPVSTYERRLRTKQGRRAAVQESRPGEQARGGKRPQRSCSCMCVMSMYALLTCTDRDQLLTGIHRSRRAGAVHEDRLPFGPQPANMPKLRPIPDRTCSMPSGWPPTCCV